MAWDQVSGPNLAIPGTVLLNTMNPNNVSSSNDVSSLTFANYVSYEIVFSNIVPVTNNSVFQMTIATSGSNFVSGGYISSVTIDGGGQGANQVTTDSYTTAFLLSGLRSTSTVGNSTAYGITGSLRIFNPSSPNFRKMINGASCFLNDTVSQTSSLCIAQFGGYFDGNSNAITGVNFAFNSGNIATGVIKIYGIK